MKTLFYGLHFLFAMCLLACNKDVTISPEQTFTLRLNETKSIATQNGLLNIHINDVEDARCPPSINCLWAGFFNIHFKLVNSNKESHLFNLSDSTTTYDLTAYPPLRSLTVLDVSYPSEQLFGKKEYAIVHLRID